MLPLDVVRSLYGLHGVLKGSCQLRRKLEYSSLIIQILPNLCFKGLVDAVHGLPVVPRSTFSQLDFQPEDLYGNIDKERS